MTIPPIQSDPYLKKPPSHENTITSTKKRKQCYGKGIITGANKSRINTQLRHTSKETLQPIIENYQKQLEGVNISEEEKKNIEIFLKFLEGIPLSGIARQKGIKLKKVTTIVHSYWDKNIPKNDDSMFVIFKNYI